MQWSRPFSRMQTDLHQHLWPAPFLAALRARRTPPRMEGWTLELPGERPYAIDPAAHDVELRTAMAAVDGDELVCVAPSAGLGLDRLPAAEVETLAEAWLEGALELPAPFRAWAHAAPARTRSRMRSAAGRSAWSSAADLLAAPGGLAALEPLLGVLEESGRPLLVHPGPAGIADAPGHRPPLVGAGRPLRHPAARRLVGVGRRGPRALPATCPSASSRSPGSARCTASAGALAAAARSPVDPLTFVETSSYGTQAVDAVVRALGIDVVCHGSDRPYAEPTLPRLGSDAALHGLRVRQPGPSVRQRPPGGDRMIQDLHVPVDGRSSATSWAHWSRGSRHGQLGATTRPARATERTYAALHRDDDVDLWAIFWWPANDTGWHDHDTSSGAVHVVDGVLGGARAAVAQPERRTRYGAGRLLHLRARRTSIASRAPRRARLDPRLLSAPVAPGPVHRRAGGRPAPAVGVLRRRAPAPRARRGVTPPVRGFALTSAARTCATPAGAYANCLALSVRYALWLRERGEPAGLLRHRAGAAPRSRRPPAGWPLCEPESPTRTG